MGNLFTLASNIVMLASAAGQSTAGSDLMSNVIKMVATIGGGIIAIFLIVAIVKDAIAFAKGSGANSIWGIVGKIVFLILCIGLIFVAQDWIKLGESAKGIGEGGLNKINEGINEIIPNGKP